MRRRTSWTAIPALWAALTLLCVTLLCVSGGRASALVTNTKASANDNFSSAKTLAPRGASVTGSTAGATKEPGEPHHAGNAGGHSIWWQWTAPATGTAVIDTCGSGFDTLLAVYTGAAVNALTSIVGDDDGRLCGITSLQSSVYFNAVIGTTYSVAVDGYNGATGAVSLHLTAPRTPGDDFAAAQTFPVDGATITATTLGATKEPGEPDHAGNDGGHSVWWSWKVAATGPAVVDTCGSGFNTLLAVYTGSAVDALTPVASNDDSASCGSGSHQSSLSFAATSGTIYSIAVDGFAGASGAVTLHGTAPGATPPGAPTVTAITSGNGWLSVSWNPPASDGGTVIENYTVTLSSGETLVVPGTALSAALPVSNDVARTAQVTATNSAGTGQPSQPSSSVTPAAVSVDVTTSYDDASNTRLLKNATYLGTSATEAQRLSVAIFAYLIIYSKQAATPPPQRAPRRVTGSNHTYTTTWAASDQFALVTVMREYDLSPSAAQLSSVQLIGYLLSTSGF